MYFSGNSSEIQHIKMEIAQMKKKVIIHIWVIHTHKILFICPSTTVKCHIHHLHSWNYTDVNGKTVNIIPLFFSLFIVLLEIAAFVHK